MRVLRGIAKGLDVPLSVVIANAHLDDDPIEPPTTRELVYMFSQLDDDDRERVLQIARTFLEAKRRRVVIGEQAAADA